MDTLEHHFCYCSVSEKFWCEINGWLYNIISVKINLSMCEILFGIMNFSYGERNVFYVMNLIILLGKWFLNRCKFNGKHIILSDFSKIFKDKLESIRMCHMLKNDLENVNKKFGILYDKFLV